MERDDACMWMQQQGAGLRFDGCGGQQQGEGEGARRQGCRSKCSGCDSIQAFGFMFEMVGGQLRPQQAGTNCNNRAARTGGPKVWELIYPNG